MSCRRVNGAGGRATRPSFGRLYLISSQENLQGLFVPGTWAAAAADSVFLAGRAQPYCLVTKSDALEHLILTEIDLDTLDSSV